MSNQIAIIGGGISGITTALTLQLLGFKTTIYAEHIVEEETPKDPRFASLYPAASIIPHTVHTDNMEQLFIPSQHIFEFLLEHEAPGMQMLRHYELFETNTAEPAYVPLLKNYARLDDTSLPNAPHRDKSARIFGWSFDCLLAEWPDYIHFLYKLYRNAGGAIIKKRIQPGTLEQVDQDIIVNCCGIWSHTLFGGPEARQVSRGLLLYLKDAPPLRDASDRVPSYNYTPGKDIYADCEGEEADVYFYPRSNGWILGGTRQTGTIDGESRWLGKKYSDTISIGGEDVPRQIYELNRQIIKNTYNIDLSRFSDISVKIGYRYLGVDKNKGLRLEESKEFEKRIIHNYGHGGAGVTLSWGCALKAAQLIQKETESCSEYNLKKMKSGLLGLM